MVDKYLVQGYFDLLHIGHCLFLEECKKQIGDSELWVGVYSDEVCRSLKGNTRPIIPQKQRLQMLTYIKVVDHAYITKHAYNSKDGYILKKFKPKGVIFSYSKSADVSDMQKNEEVNFIRNNFKNIEILFIKRQTESVSTTKIIDKILNVSTIS